MRELKVAKARDMGQLFVENPHRMVGQDGAYSIPLGDGTALWFFGDTLIGARVPGESLWYPGGQQLGPGDMSGHGLIEKLHNNTGLIMRDQTGSTELKDFRYLCDPAGNLRQLIVHEASEPPDEIRVWCLHGVALGEMIYLYYLTVRMLASGPLPVNFEILGAGLAAGTRQEMKFHRIRQGGRTLWWNAGLPQFGTTVLPGTDDYLYVYGVLKGSDGVQRSHVARVRPTAIENLSAYQYLTSDAPVWGKDPAAAVSIMEGMPNEMSVSWNAHLGCYLAVHSLDLSGNIVGRTASNPWGPWSTPTVLWKCIPPTLDYPHPYFTMIYAGKEHPEIAGQNGKVLYLTYIEFEEYFPHLVEVVLGS